TGPARKWRTRTAPPVHAARPGGSDGDGTSRFCGLAPRSGAPLASPGPPARQARSRLRTVHAVPKVETHDDGIHTRPAVVTLSQTDAPEPEPLVQGTGAGVVGTHLEDDPSGARVPGAVEEGRHEGRGDPLPPV